MKKIKIKHCIENDYIGVRVSNAGDVNGDGLDDVMIGASQMVIFL